MLSILMYLFERYITVETLMPAPEELTDELNEAGFRAHDIDAAFRWLAELEEHRHTYLQPSDSSAYSHRIYTAREQQLVGTANLAFLRFLHDHKLISGPTRELILDRALAMGNQQPIDEEDFRWLTLFVLTCQTQEREVPEWMEHLIFMDHHSETLH